VNVSVIVAALGLSLTAASAAELVLRSGERQTSLLELYTSEGCSSCPSAEKWLGLFRKNPQLWLEVVPVAFHVDYWDQLGWPDRFASPEYSARQRRYSVAWGQSPYTPGFVLDGREWRNYGIGKIPENKVRAGILKALAESDKVNVQFIPAGDFSGGTAHAVWLGTGLTTEVKRGENVGRRLAHDFVALNHGSVILVKGNNGWSADVSDLTPPPEASALAVWVEENGQPVQAVGGWLKKP